MRSTHWIGLVGLLGVVVTACGDDRGAGSIRQVAGDTGLVIEDGGVIVPDTGLDTAVDVIDDTTGDTRPGDTAPGDTGEVTDTTDADTIADTSVDTTEVDVAPLDCNVDGECPGSVCGAGRCESGRCVVVPSREGEACDDGDVCTKNDKCREGTCAAGEAVTCDDGNACTDDSCRAGVGCEFTPKRCDDGNACTVDECKPALGCVSSPLVCPPPGNVCQRIRCDTALGCVSESAGDVACSDDDGCTSNDRCVGTVCVGEPLPCNDNNPCTADACVAGGCVSTPISGCATDAECIGRLAGDACSDGNEATTGDMCLLGSCRGFALTRIAGTTVANQQGLVVLETVHGSDGWVAIYWVADLTFRNRFMLANIDNPASPTTYANTLQDRLFTGLRDGFVADTAGRVWRSVAGAWTRANAWDTAVGSSGRGAIYDMWTVRDRSAQGVDGPRRMWLVGEKDGDSGWLRYCVEQNGGVTCAAQDLDDFDNTSIPQAVDGSQLCTTGCSSAALVSGADAWDGGTFFTDTYENVDGITTLWAQGRIPDQSVNKTTEAVATWLEGGNLRAVVVGTNGYVVVRRGDGSWSDELTLREGQSSRTFNAAWQGAGAVFVAASRRVSSTTLAYELWVAPNDSDLEDGGSWTVHELGRSSNVNAAGLYGVSGRTTGEVRAVGAIRRTSGIADWLDGAVWVRSP